MAAGWGTSGGDPLFARAVRGSCGAARIPDGQVLSQYHRLRQAGQLPRHLVVEYRCAEPAGCVLARLFITPSGTFVHKPAGRAAVGYGVRPETAYSLPTPPGSVVLSCGHLHVRRDVDAVLGDIALAHRRGCPTGRRIAH